MKKKANRSSNAQSTQKNPARNTFPPSARPAPLSRNQPCPCGSGKKYKHCCALKAYVAKPDAELPQKKFWRPVTYGFLALAFAVAILVGALKDVNAGLWVFAAELGIFFIVYALSDPPPPHETLPPNELPPPLTESQLKALEKQQLEAQKPRRRQIPR